MSKEDLIYNLQIFGLMFLHVLAYAGVTWLMWRYYRKREITVRERILIGIAYGAMAVLSTHLGINYGSMVINVRDMAPMTAGLFFDPVSGLIAGAIGGVERYIAGKYMEVGTFTTLACSISTCFAGVFAAFANIYLFKGKKPSIVYSFFMGAVIEVFHMYAIFATHRQEMFAAFMIVRTVAMPMILITAVGLAICSAVVMFAGEGLHNPFKRPDGVPASVTDRFQMWLFGVTAAVLLLSFMFNFSNQTRIAIQNAEYDMDISAEDIRNNYNAINRIGLDPSRLKMHVGSDGFFVIVDSSDRIVAGSDTELDNFRKLIKYSKSQKESEFFYWKRYVKYLCMYRNVDDGGRLIVMIPETIIFQERDSHAYQTFLSDILVFTVIYVLVSLLVQYLVVENLVKVNKSLNKITEGDLNERVEVYSSYEFASLSDDINLTVDALKGYIEAAEKRIEQELLLAKTIQSSALPTNFDYGNRAFELYATMDPAKEVGGDFYDFFLVDTNRMALVIADVSGKGIPGALFMMRSKTAIRGLAETGFMPADVLERVNEELCTGNDANMFVTVWIGIIDLVTGDMRCANAGHEFPALRRGEGRFESFRDKHGLPLGAMEGMRYKEYDLHLDPGDTLYVYTDGVPEAINTEEEQYGEARMLTALSRNRKASMKKLLQSVKRDLDKFVGEAEQFDDITMLGFRYNGPEQEEAEKQDA